MKRSYYFARRIPIHASEEECIPLTARMTANDIHRCYVDKVLDRGAYLSNGPWILRPFVREGVHQPNRFPDDLLPQHVWKMVREKIASSSAVVALIDPLAYGTIAELNYAAGLGTVAVYALPAPHVEQEEYVDLWLSFQVASYTSDLWCEEDIRNIDLFAKRDITSLDDYRRFIASIVPKFLRKKH